MIQRNGFPGAEGGWNVDKERPAIEHRFAALFKGNLRGTNRTDTVRTIPFYAPDLAFVEAETVILGSKTSDGSVGPMQMFVDYASRQAAKVAGAWWCVTSGFIRNSRMDTWSKWTS